MRRGKGLTTYYLSASSGITSHSGEAVELEIFNTRQYIVYIQCQASRSIILLSSSARARDRRRTDRFGWCFFSLVKTPIQMHASL